MLALTKFFGFGFSLTGVPWVNFVLVLAAVLAALSVIWRVAVRPTYRFITGVTRTTHAVVKLAEQFENNGGASMRDAVDRIEASVALVRDDVKDLRDRVTVVEARP